LTKRTSLDRLDDMVEQAFDDQCTGANPRYPLMSEIKQMYLNAYYGNHFVETAKAHRCGLDPGRRSRQSKGGLPQRQDRVRKRNKRRNQP
jgi:hypothetical protein